MLVRTKSRDSSKQFNQNPSETWHYVFTKMTPPLKQNQWLTPRAPAPTVEDGHGDWGGKPPAPEQYIDLSHYQRAIAGM
jgi:hypothetical protein